jgi:hypothetical protein
MLGGEERIDRMARLRQADRNGGPDDGLEIPRFRAALAQWLGG